MYATDTYNKQDSDGASGICNTDSATKEPNIAATQEISEKKWDQSLYNPSMCLITKDFLPLFKSLTCKSWDNLFYNSFCQKCDDY